MTVVLVIALALVAVAVLAAVWRTLRGPTPADRAVAAEMVFIAFVSAFAILAVLLDSPPVARRCPGRRAGRVPDHDRAVAVRRPDAGPPMTPLEVLATLLLLPGAALVALAGVGLVRLPDPLTRATAVSKAASLGAVLVLLGVLLADPQPRTFVLVGLILVAHLVTSPLSGLALGRAAYRSGTARPPVTRIDEPAVRSQRGARLDRPTDPAGPPRGTPSTTGDQEE